MLAGILQFYRSMTIKTKNDLFDELYHNALRKYISNIFCWVKNNVCICIFIKRINILLKKLFLYDACCCIFYHASIIISLVVVRECYTQQVFKILCFLSISLFNFRNLERVMHILRHLMSNYTYISNGKN